MRDVIKGERRHHHPPPTGKAKECRAGTPASCSSGSSSTTSLSTGQADSGHASNRLARFLNRTKGWTARHRIRLRANDDWEPPVPSSASTGVSTSRRKLLSTGNAQESNSMRPPVEISNHLISPASTDGRPDLFAPHLSHDDSCSSAPVNLRVLTDMFDLMTSEDPEVAQDTLATIFQLARRSPTTRNLILEGGGLKLMLQQIQRNGPADLSTAGAIYHLTRDPLPPFRLIKSAVPLLLKLIETSDEEQVVLVSCYVLYALSTVEDINAPDYINQIVPFESHARFANLLKHTSIDIRFRALRIINQIALADRLHGPQASRSHCGESLITGRFLSTVEHFVLDLPETQPLAIQLIQHLFVNHHAAILRVCPDVVSAYFALAKDQIGHLVQVISSLLPAFREASKEELGILDELGGSDIAGGCLAECDKLVAHMEELRLLKGQCIF